MSGPDQTRSDLFARMDDTMLAGHDGHVYLPDEGSCRTLLGLVGERLDAGAAPGDTPEDLVADLAMLVGCLTVACEFLLSERGS